MKFMALDEIMEKIEDSVSLDDDSYERVRVKLYTVAQELEELRAYRKWIENNRADADDDWYNYGIDEKDIE